MQQYSERHKVTDKDPKRPESAQDVARMTEKRYKNNVQIIFIGNVVVLNADVCVYILTRSVNLRCHLQTHTYIKFNIAHIQFRQQHEYTEVYTESRIKSCPQALCLINNSEQIIS